jgi:urease accessory protein
MGDRTPATAVEGLLSGLAHPVIGIDHFLFVLATGAACYYFGHRRATPAAFLLGALAGTALHLQSSAFAYADAAVALSLVLLGVLLFGAHRFLKSRVAVGAFAIAGMAHGYAYGESIIGAEPTPLFAYLAGYIAVQLSIVLLGYAAARYADSTQASLRALKVWGSGLISAGAAFLLFSLTA